MKLIYKILPVVLLFGSIIYYFNSDMAVNNKLQNLQRVIVLNNGLTFNIKPKYKRNLLCVNLRITNGFARLGYDENYDIHPIDKDGFDVASIKFYDEDFNQDFEACKCKTVEKLDIYGITKFKMRYPAWVEDR